MPFVKGQSGNPAGRAHGSRNWVTFSADLRRIMAEGPPNATVKENLLRGLIDIALNGESEGTRLKAIQMILERVDGTPRQSIDMFTAPVNPLDGLSTEELNQRLASLGFYYKPSNPLDAIEVRVDP